MSTTAHNAAAARRAAPAAPATVLYEVRDSAGRGHGTYLDRRDALAAAAKSGLVRPSVVTVGAAS